MILQIKTAVKIHAVSATHNVCCCARRMLCTADLGLCIPCASTSCSLHCMQATLDDVKVSQLSGAMTNLIYRCRYQRGPEVGPLTSTCKVFCPSARLQLSRFNSIKALHSSGFPCSCCRRSCLHWQGCSAISRTTCSRANMSP